MDLKQIEYILKIAEENNITRAAEKLYLSQSALNQQLLKLEKELGTTLFHRSRTNWRPTHAGEIYIAAAKEILHIKQDTYNQIFDLAQQNKGTLSIGFTPNRGTSMFSAVYPLFHQKHPQIHVEPVELSVAEQLERISEYSLDIGFLTLLPHQKKNGFSYLPIKTEEIYLAVPASHCFQPDSVFPAPSSGRTSDGHFSFPVLSLEQLKEESFVLLYKQSTIRMLVDSLFRNAGYEPHVLFETASTYTILHMIESGLCCGLIPEYYVDPANPNIRFYSLPCHPTWDVVSCCNSHSYTSTAAKDFMALAKSYWTEK